MIAVIRLDGHNDVRGVSYPEQPAQFKRVEVLRIDGHGLTLGLPPRPRVERVVLSTTANAIAWRA